MTEFSAQNRAKIEQLSKELPQDRAAIFKAQGYRKACDRLQKEIERAIKETPETPATGLVRMTLDAVLIRIIQVRCKADE